MSFSLKADLELARKDELVRRGEANAIERDVSPSGGVGPDLGEVRPELAGRGQELRAESEEIVRNFADEVAVVRVARVNPAAAQSEELWNRPDGLDQTLLRRQEQQRLVKPPVEGDRDCGRIGPDLGGECVE